MAPGRQHDARGAGAVQGDQPGLPGPVRSAGAPALRHVRGGRGQRRAGGRRRVRRLRRVQRHLRCLLRWRRGGQRGSPRPTAAGCGPALRPAPDLRGSDQRHREGDRVPGPPPLRDVQGEWRQGRRGAGHVPAVRRPRRGPQRAPDDAGTDGQRQRLPALQGRGQDHRIGLRDLQGRRPHRATSNAPRDDPARHRRGPPDPAVQRGRGRTARWSGRQPVRGGPRRRAQVAQARRHRALFRGGRLHRPGRARDPDHGPDGRWVRGGRDQARDPARDRDPAARQGRAAPAPQRVARRPPRAGQCRRADEADEAPEGTAVRVRGRVGRDHPRHRELLRQGP